MQTVLRSKTKEVKIDPQSAFVIIGEKINPTGRKKLAAALQEGNLEYVKEIAANQVAAGADLLDVNVGVPGLDDVAMLPRVVQMLSENFDIPLCLDTPNPLALEAAMRVAPGKVLINSVNGEEKSLAAVLPIVKAYDAAVIGLTMDDSGIPNDAETRTAIAGKILERAAKIGIPPENVVIDPLVLTVGADSKAARVTLQTIEMVRREFGVNINIGASNVSFGLPERDVVNQSFLALAIQAGATCAITDPMKYGLFIKATDLLLGRDNYAAKYIKYYKAHPKEEPAKSA
jgi:5-methyltetrahydrofolate--homocysteine methyltransferase